ncbi:MAG: D-sedoheptulose 7-phosphate isomerase [Solirubrobacteraceae bacterium]|jgi:D-sedoheptulose 7-phosphate isomerase|nr:D-sedoheptulose 7-phosphate isomerase [Solirubrobacteraceae bacterium]
MLTHSERYLQEAAELVSSLPAATLERMAQRIAAVRERGGRLFILGVGGGAAHASHAVNDFRKICHIEAYAPTDNVAELTARINDEGWETTFREWLRTSRLGGLDALLVFSVGGGSREHNVSLNLVEALELAREVGSDIFGVVGRPDGATARLADECVVIDAPSERTTPHVEALQAVCWHLLVAHPALSRQAGKWESVVAPTQPA